MNLFESGSSSHDFEWIQWRWRFFMMAQILRYNCSSQDIFRYIRSRQKQKTENPLMHAFFFFNFYFYFILLYNTVLVLPYINMNPPWVYICSPSWTPLPPSSIPFLWVIPVHQPQASSIMHRTWTGDSFHTWYYTCFNAILPNHPTFSLSHWNGKHFIVITVISIITTIMSTYNVLSLYQALLYHLYLSGNNLTVRASPFYFLTKVWGLTTEVLRSSDSVGLEPKTSDAL